MSTIPRHTDKRFWSKAGACLKNPITNRIMSSRSRSRRSHRCGTEGKTRVAERVERVYRAWATSRGGGTRYGNFV